MSEQDGWRVFVAKIMAQNRDRIMELTRKESFEFAGVKYVRHKITTQQFQELEAMRAELEDMPPGKKLDAARKAAEIYRRMAQCYLHMDEQTFYGLPWAEVKEVLDTLAWEEANGRPLS